MREQEEKKGNPEKARATHQLIIREKDFDEIQMDSRATGLDSLFRMTQSSTVQKPFRLTDRHLPSFPVVDAALEVLQCTYGEWFV